MIHIVYALLKYCFNSKNTFLDWPPFTSILSASPYPRFWIFFKEKEEKSKINLIKITQLMLNVCSPEYSFNIPSKHIFREKIKFNIALWDKVLQTLGLLKTVCTIFIVTWSVYDIRYDILQISLKIQPFISLVNFCLSDRKDAVCQTSSSRLLLMWLHILPSSGIQYNTIK